MAIVALNPGVINTDMLTSCFGTSAASYQPPDAWYVTLFLFMEKEMPSSFYICLVLPLTAQETCF